jgi:hypothetical protein
MEGLTVEMLGTIGGATMFIYLALALFVKPLIARKPEEWQEHNTGLAINFLSIFFGQIAVGVAGLALGIDATEWINHVLIGLLAAGASTGVYEVKKNIGKARF